MFSLELTFTGLFCFVPDEESGRLVAVLPTTGPLSTGPVHQHHATLAFHRAYLVRPDDHSHGLAVASVKDVETIPLGRTRLSLAGVAGGGALIKPPAAANLHKLSGVKLDPAQISVKPHDTVHAQVVLPGADDMSEPEKVAWKFRPHPQEPRVRLCNKLLWTKDVPDDHVQLQFQYLGGTTIRTLTLYSPGPYGKIELELRHLPTQEIKIPLGGRAEHFNAYYDLLDPAPPPDKRQIPVLDEVPPEPAADTYTCMTAQAVLGDSEAAGAYEQPAD